MPTDAGENRGRQAWTFARVARLYWLAIFPLTCRERRRWQGRAERIPDPALRRDALFSLRTKWGHSEGAAAFAVLAPPAHRRSAARMAIAFQSMIDYLDTISERPANDPFANTLTLHRALDAAVSPDPPEELDYYALHSHRGDGGFLTAHIAACRNALLPGWPAVAATASRFAALYGEAQGICHARESGWQPPDSAQRTRTEAARHPELLWGEMLAAGASSLQVHALIGVAGSPLPERDVESIAAAYCPWVGALHILLHGLVDQAADEEGGQFNQLNHYRSKPEAAERLALIASHARELVMALPQGDAHAAILSGMAGYYLAPRQVWEPEDAEVSSSALRALGPLTKPALLVHRTRREGPRAAMRPLRPS